MKTRIISAIVGLAVLGVAILLYDTIIANILLALLAGIAVWELLHAAGLEKYKVYTGVSTIYSMLFIFCPVEYINKYVILATFVYIVFSFCYLMFYHHELNVKDILFGNFMAIFVTGAFYSLVSMRDMNSPEVGLFYLAIVFGSAWWSDTGAYFTGTFFGKHKLCPTISPKKTVEGLIGGIAAAVIGNVLVAYGYMYLCGQMSASGFGYITNAVSIDIGIIALITPVLSLMGVLGDLSASIIKRQNGIKDYGNIMPGHGGVMDRFDSVLFVCPLVYYVFKFFPVIHLL